MLTKAKKSVKIEKWTKKKRQQNRKKNKKKNTVIWRMGS